MGLTGSALRTSVLAAAGVLLTVAVPAMFAETPDGTRGEGLEAARSEVRQQLRQVVRFEVVGAAPGDDEGATATVSLEPGEPGGGARSFTVPLPGSAEIPLTAGGLRRLEVTAEGYWAAPTVVMAGTDPPPVVHLHPTGELTGTLEVAQRNAALPQGLAVIFEPTDPRRLRSPTVPAGRLECPVDPRGAWSCPVPAGRHDLRLKADGFASLFRWEVEVVAGGSVALGRSRLHPGSSLVGFVEAAEGTLDPHAVEVSLVAASRNAPSIVVKRRLQRLGAAAPVDRSGFFQLTDLDPGIYRIEVAADGFAPLVSRPLELLPGLETELREPLVLQRPAFLKVTVDPPIHPWDGTDWAVALLPRDPNQSAAEDRTGDDGTALLPGLASGRYTLLVEGPDRARWDRRDVELLPGDQTLAVELPMVPVEGRVLRGGEPVRARLTFGNTRMEREVVMISDPAGAFRGFLPREGPWPLSVAFSWPGPRQALEPVRVEQTGSGPAELEIEIPDTRLEGRVVDRRGRPVADAEIRVQPYAAPNPDSEDREDPALRIRLSSASSDGDGRFRLEGLPAGTYAVEASLGPRSGRADARVEEGRHGPAVEVPLSGTLELQGRVASDRGGVAGARIFALPELALDRSVTVAEAASDPLGDFRLTLPEDTHRLDLLVLAPGQLAAIHSLGGADLEEGVVEVRVTDLGGGTLRLQGADPSTTTLVHRGARIPYLLLETWAALHGTGRSGDGAAEIPALPPGRYAACPSRQAAVGGGTCAGGLLAPGSTLVLRLPGSMPSAVGRGTRASTPR